MEVEKKFTNPDMLKKYATFIRYIISGMTSVVVQFGVLALMIEGFHADATLSSASGFIIGCLVNYLMLYYWTFNAHGNHLAATLKYTLITLLALGLNTVIFRLLTYELHIWYLFSQSFATMVVSLLTYVINRRYTFAGG